MYYQKTHPAKCPMCLGKLWAGYEEKELAERLYQEYRKKRIGQEEKEWRARMKR
jgi:hypothetical protein